MFMQNLQCGQNALWVPFNSDVSIQLMLFNIQIAIQLNYSVNISGRDNGFLQLFKGDRFNISAVS